ncbi:hypothetical protein C2G38_558308 [Gigaspora rosea]|uniref:Uncharacterized protein n=1 Tax=Gigaspora rosea TaxID=44941 RepID=A0A397VTF3_9GLOM|nr:hypothetical protein C2G38_558308 [Gigaspora rosea]
MISQKIDLRNIETIRKRLRVLFWITNQKRIALKLEIVLITSSSRDHPRLSKLSGYQWKSNLQSKTIDETQKIREAVSVEVIDTIGNQYGETSKRTLRNSTPVDYNKNSNEIDLYVSDHEEKQEIDRRESDYDSDYEPSNNSSIFSDSDYDQKKKRKIDKEKQPESRVTVGYDNKSTSSLNSISNNTASQENSSQGSYSCPYNLNDEYLNNNDIQEDDRECSNSTNNSVDDKKEEGANSNNINEEECVD